MRKFLIYFFTAAATLLCFTSAFALDITYDGKTEPYTAPPITLKINGKTVVLSKMPPVILNARTMVPAREVFEALGAVVDWDGETQKVSVSYGDTAVLLTIDSYNVQIGSASIVQIDPGDMPPKIINDKTMIPVRFVAEKLDFKVSWDEASRTVSINAPKVDNASQSSGAKTRITAIKSDADSQFDSVYISMGTRVSPSISRLSNSERVVLDFENVSLSLPNGQTPGEGNVLENVRYADHDGRVRVVLDVKTQPQISVLAWSGGVLIRVHKNPCNALIYDGIAKKIYFDSAYAFVSDSLNGSDYSLTLKTQKLPEGTIEIGDDCINDIKLSKSGNNTVVAVSAKQELPFLYSSALFAISFDAKGVSPPQSDGGELRVALDAAVPNKTVVLDPGHGGNDIGASFRREDGSFDIIESEINRSIALKTRVYLQNAGVTVIMTRSTDTYVSLADRVAISAGSGAAAFISIHCNAMENQPDVKGSMVFYHPGADYNSVINTKTLASNIKDGILFNTEFTDKSVRDGATLYVLRHNTIPAVLVECAFVSNESDRAALNDENTRDNIAKGIAEGIIQTLNATK